MSVDIMLPNIDSPSMAGQVKQMQSYMYQLVEQLNWALNAVGKAEKGEDSPVVIQGSGLEDITQADSLETFNSIKGLIIKSADIVSAYSEILKREYDGRYVATSDFGSFVSDTNATITESSENINALFTETDTISTTIQMMRQTEAYIKTGKLSDGVYGIEVGQTINENGEDVFRKWARFTSEGIYFYTRQSTEPIAYMTGLQLVITSADIKLLKLGVYQIDTTDGLAFKWVGR